MTRPPGGGAFEATPDRELLEQMRRISVALFVGGGLVCLSGVWMTQETPESRLGQAVVAGVFVALGVGVYLVRPPRRRLIEAALVGSVVLLSMLVAVSEPLGMAPFFYLWPVVYAAYFCGTRLLGVTYGAAVVTLAIALLVNDTIDLKLDTFTGTVATVGAMGALVHAMTRQERRLRDELALAADTDPLTGLLNRRSFDPRLRLLVDQARDHHKPVSVVIVDIDHFKVLNDTHGHLVGDEALQNLALVLVNNSRDGDLVARLGGEEFAVALAVSVGGCALGGDEAADASSMIAKADEALYAAKNAGRRRFAWWADGIEIGERFDQPTPA